MVFSALYPIICRPKGEISLFDRSWYNRAGVERVDGLLLVAEQVTEHFLQAVPEFERQLVDDGILLFKYWLCRDQEKQEERFAGAARTTRCAGGSYRPSMPRPARYYDAYTEARERMLEATDSRPGAMDTGRLQRSAVGRLTLLPRPA